ncbi:hypothetical protein MTR67_045210 [Solanum verrucosum]|uniref:AAA+ ATPase domain-containing protein n=2 Tax=Solanum verrucosum TaxID=315347 RepID=A0AAF0UTM9_SOLVR|nr:hypothetical protein MTR67_045210 [Solanum verrucosum]
MGLEEKLETVKRMMEVLISRRKDIADEVKDAEHHSSKRRKTEVENWQNSVQKLEHEFECFEQEVEQSSSFSRIGLSNRADKIHEEVEYLLDQGKFSEGILLHLYEGKMQPLVMTNLKGEAFVESLRKVITPLNEVSSIGIYGMGGVGKTTLAMHIHDHLLKESRFSGNVYWITVSQDFSISKIQNNIAKTIGLDLSSEDDDKKRTAKLFHSLKRKKSFVLILDDVWNIFDVTKVGIPLEIGGGKLIITSRSSEVCDKIGCQKKVKVETLSMTESWELFIKTLGCQWGDLSMEMEEIAKKMTKNCDGLPLGIITMAASMRGVNDVFEWRDAFEEFKDSCMEMENMNNDVFPILQCSYNRLRDPKLQKCFLYCCFYPEDYKIRRDELVRLLIVEELLVKRNSRKAELDQGYAVLNKLERACLLESVVNGNGSRCVRMHDLVREMALRIAGDEINLMVRAGAQLREIPGEQEWSEDLDKVSLMNNDISKISQPLSSICPKLTTLLLQGNCSLSQVIDPFFTQMPGLRVLDLSYTAIHQLPSSVSNLVSLSALLLRRCYGLRFVPPLNNLKNLIELDLFHTIIQEVPQGLESLVKLRCLDMTRNERVPKTLSKKPAVDILARLSNLQFLSIPFVVRVEDLLGMRQLEVFHGKFIDVCSFNRFVKYQQRWGKPSSFVIALDTKSSSEPILESDHLSYDLTFYGERVILRHLLLTGDSIEMLRYDQIEDEARNVTLLPVNIQELLISECDFRMLGDSLLDTIPSLIQTKDLRLIKIGRCNGIEFLIRTSNCRSTRHQGPMSTYNTLETLERLVLHCLKEFSGLCKLELVEPLPPVGTFSHLRCLDVSFCDKMKKLIPKWLLQYLQNLTEITVRICEEMEEIIADDEEEQVNQCASSSNIIVLPKLQILYLHALPELKSIYKGRMTCGSIQRVTVSLCGKLKRLPFTLLPLQNGQPSAPPDLEFIRMSEKSWKALDWDHPQYKNVLHPFVKKS